MEIAAAALSSLASAVAPATAAVGIGSDVVASGAAAAGTAAATTGAAAAGGGLLSSIGGASLFGSILQGGLGLVGAMSAIRAGQNQSQQLMQQATVAEGDATQAATTGMQQANDLKSKLVATLGQRDVAYAASGVDLSFGTPATARSQAVTDAASALEANDANTSATADRLRARAAGYRKMAADAETAGNVTAAGDVLNAGARILMRG